MRHVAFVIDSEAFGGAEVYATLLVRHLPAGVHRTVVVSDPVAGPVCAAVGETADVVVVPPSRHRPVAPWLSRTLVGLAPDVVHVNLVDPGGNRAALMAAADVAPTVATLHLTGADGPGPADAYRRVSCFTAPSAAIAAQLARLAPGAPIVRVRSGVDLPAEGVCLRDRSPVVIGGVGRLTAQKGFDLLIQAAAELTQEGLPIRIVVAGRGRDRDVLAHAAEDLPVTFIGHIQDVGALLRDVDVFCLPSRNEALSLTLLEAMGHGLPCVSTAVGDTAAEVGSDALVVPPGDPAALTAALRRLVADAGTRRELGRRARVRALAAFDARRMAADTFAVLTRTAAARQPSPGPGERPVASR
ncbi:glycosyltransferase family 4 protein [Sphaerimonospora thailandensis]|uniref:Glycosyltransferase subfamily 4-like N-terminal domain-containing protein n=1 Tax=Sphaerimonospora thailandensis TaxID=795644 RepID=A0A8J3R4S2_9ACTN|nr:glycosyltransferase family 4 protein [Sphaerimonospora thailandensis]GIH67949.1 hypothetical protein Mth01_02020 [Sphaerimonospora thailandensis]